MQSQITALEARNLVAAHDKMYTDICNAIKQAANNGKTEVIVKDITCYEIRARLSDDNFDLTCNKDEQSDKYSHRIWWGSGN